MPGVPDGRVALVSNAAGQPRSRSASRRRCRDIAANY